MSTSHTSKSNANGSLLSYVIGFVLSILLTIAAYQLVVQHTNSADANKSNNLLIAQIIILAFIQFIVQLVFFLHLGRGKNARESQLVLVFMVVVVAILVVGSLWIMANLDYSHGNMDSMTPKEIDNAIIEDQGLRPL